MNSPSSMLTLPSFVGYAVYYLLTTPGTLRERLSKGIKPVIRMRADALVAKQKREAAAAANGNAKEVELRLMDDEEGKH